MPPETALSDFIDINILPERHRPLRLPRRTIILALVTISLLLAIFPLYFASADISNKIADLEAELQPIRVTLEALKTPAPEVQKLIDTLSQTQQTTGELEEAYSTIAASHADWAAIMAAITNYDPAELALTSLTQADSQITLNGRAIDGAIVANYARGLRESDLFSSVEVQSMSSAATPFVTETNTPEPTLTPTVTPEVTGTPPTPTPMPTPTGTIMATATPTYTVMTTVTPITGPDEYEIDDFQPKDIILYPPQPQLHNFHPVYDVDRVKFLAKNERYYRVYTSDLRPGVDTYLEVSIGGTSYTNDDCHSGDLSSCIEFQVTTGHDVEASVKASNRGQYGPEMLYVITVEEIAAPTPTPVTPTDTPVPPTDTPKPTETPEPTATTVPTAPPPPTPDLRDLYEPDDADSQPIAVGETQARNFFPDGDVDKVAFGVKEGRLYALTTSNPATGVDTKIVVMIDGEQCLTCENDDTGPGFLESEVRFVATADGTAEATISVGQSGQYGADKTYDLTLTLLSSSVDQYEPDDPFAKPIAVEGTQEHNFYPDGDRDLVKFLAKGLRHYAVYTSNLVEGVDTYLKITLGPYTWENDDHSPGTGNFASEVCFQAPITDTAVVLITNMQQYDINKTYEIAVSEAPILVVSPLSRSFTAVAGGDNPSSREVNIINGGGGILTWAAIKDELATWLNISPESGATSGDEPSVMSVSVDITGLTEGTYVGQIAIDGTSSRCCAEPCWETVTVVLQVIAPTPTPIPPTPEPTPTEQGFLPRPPGLASLRSPLTRGNRTISGLLSPDAVEFVIVLELKMGSP